MAKTYQIETSLTLDYRSSVWGLERIVLDSFCNHLPEDSKGTAVAVRFKQDGQWKDLKTVDPKLPVKEIVFEDNGSGYDAGMLSVLFSTKTADALSVGQFGEGLKMAAAAALRKGLHVEYRSRNWKARPYTKPEAIDNHSFNRLCFEVTKNGDQLEGSRTVFTDPTPELVREVLSLPEKVLCLNEEYQELSRKMPLITSGPTAATTDFSSFFAFDSSSMPKKAPKPRQKYLSRIIDLGDKTPKAVFVKGIKVQDGQENLFSYDLGVENISPDRAFVHQDVLLEEVESLLKSCNNPHVIETVLKKAEAEPYGHCLEFSAFMHGMQRKSSSQVGLSREAHELYSRFKINLQELDYSEPILPSLTGLISKFNWGTESNKILTTKKYAVRSMSAKQGHYESLWVETFRQLYGKDAVLASEDTNIDKDAKIMGFRPIRLHHAVRDYLSDWGIISAGDIDNAKEYRWIDLSELTAEEREVLSSAPQLSQILGESADVEVRVYSGLFLKSGREIESSAGICITESDEKKYIGIKKCRLGCLEDFAETYLHELGHQVTGANDADRRFAGYFIRRVAEHALEQLKKGKPEEKE